jgi:glycosyltransferase involved in cell wall biosynthesis
MSSISTSLATSDAVNVTGADLRPPRKRLRVLHVAEAFGGGVYGVVKDLAERAAREGHAIAIAYGRRPETPADVRGDIDEGVELFAMPWKHRGPGPQIAAAAQLRRIVRAWKPDIVHLHSTFATVVGSVVLRREGARIVSTPHAYAFSGSARSAPRRWAYKMLEEYAARRVDLVGAVSPSEGAVARDVLGARRVKVVENGIAELDDAPENAEIELRPPRVVAMGRAEPQRRPEQVAAIMTRVRSLAEVEWIGDESTSEAGIQALREADITVTGWMPRCAAIERLALARAYLHWTAWDGHPLSILEAMARDVVVVASDIPACRDVIGDEQSCATVDEAAALLRRILTDDDYAIRLLERQRERRRRFSANRMAAEWLDTYFELLGG